MSRCGYGLYSGGRGCTDSQSVRGRHHAIGMLYYRATVLKEPLADDVNSPERFHVASLIDRTIDVSTSPLGSERKETSARTIENAELIGARTCQRSNAASLLAMSTRRGALMLLAATFLLLGVVLIMVPASTGADNCGNALQHGKDRPSAIWLGTTQTSDRRCIGAR